MEFRILGPLEVCDADQVIALSGARQRALLTLLLLHANHSVPADRLIEDLWHGEPPREALKSLQMHIGRLRRALGPARDLLETVSGGYRLNLQPDALDLSRFEQRAERGRRLVADGRFAEAARDFAAALSEWRGGALDDIAYEPFAQAEIGRLEDLRVSTFEDYIDAELALGHHSEWVGRIQALAVQHPFRERLTQQVILALYRSGRQADALEAFQRARRRLTEDLGLELSRTLQDLQVAVLAHDPALDWVPVTGDGQAQASPRLPRPLHDDAAFVGRRTELDRLTRAWRSVSAGHRRVVLVSGEPGIGKTRLSTRIAAHAHGEGATVLYGRCDEHLAIPYRPWIDVLTQCVDGASATLVQRHVAAFGAQVGRLTPSLRRRVEHLPPVHDSHPEIEQFRLMDAVHGLLDAAGEARPLVIFLDDLHWADKPTLTLLCHVVSQGEALKALVIATFRDSEVSDDFRHSLAALQRESGVERLAVRGLDPEDVVALVRLRSGQELSHGGVEFAHALTQDTSGNPFFIGEMLRHHVESGTLHQEHGRWRLTPEHRRPAVPDSVRDIIGHRVQRLGDTTAGVLRAAAVIGVEFDLYLLAAVLEREPDDLLDPLDLARRARLVQEDEELPARYRFAHALVSHTLRLELGSTRRARLHEQVARVLDERPDAPPGVLAYHWRGAHLHGEAIRASRRAGHAALESLAPAEAARWFGEALALQRAQTHVDPRLECDLLTDLGEAQRRAGDAAYRETLLAAAGIARRLQDAERLASAALANTRGFESVSGSVDHERVADLRAALALSTDGDPLRRARLLALLALERTFDAPIDERRRLSDEAVQLSRRDPATYAFVLWARHTVLWTPELLEEHADNAAQLRNLAAVTQDPVVAFLAACDSAFTAVWQADLVGVDAALEEMVAITARVGKRHPIWSWAVAWYSTWRAHLAGRLDEAERLALRAADLGKAQPDARAFLADQLAAIRWDQGRLPELVPLLREVVSTYPGLALFKAWLALAVTHAGRPEEARILLQPSVEAAFTDVRRDIVWLSTLCLYAEVCVRTGQLDAATALYEQIRPFADQVVFNSSIVLGSAHWFLGRLAGALGDSEASSRHLAQAAEVHRRLDAPAMLARGAPLQTAPV